MCGNFISNTLGDASNAIGNVLSDVGHIASNALSNPVVDTIGLGLVTGGLAGMGPLSGSLGGLLGGSTAADAGTLSADATFGGMGGSYSAADLGLAGGGSSGVLGSLSSLGSDVTSGLKALGVTPMQGLAMGAGLLGAMNQPGITPNAQMMQQAQAPGQAATAGFSQYSSGQLAPSDTLAIAQWQSGQEQQIKNYYAKAGLGDSSMMQQALEQVGTQANALRDQARQGYLQQALSAAGISSRDTALAVQTGLAQSQEASNALGNFSKALAMMSMPIQQQQQGASGG